MGNGRSATAGAVPGPVGLAGADAETLPPEETLDPDDCGAFRALAHEMLDRVIDLHGNVP